jgi:hypothetical protein
MAMLNTMPSAASTTPAAYKNSMLRTPSAAATATSSTRTARVALVAINVRRRRTRSIHTPATRPTTMRGKNSVMRSAAIWAGVA